MVSEREASDDVLSDRYIDVSFEVVSERQRVAIPELHRSIALPFEVIFEPQAFHFDEEANVITLGLYEIRLASYSKSVQTGKPQTIEFATAPEWHDVFYDKPTPQALTRLRVWLRDHPDDNIILYHGTKAKYPIMTQGLLPTGRGRRNSLQSRSGHVSLSVYPGHAFDFGRLGGNHMDAVALYRVTLPVRRAVPDTDQLKNMRMWGGDASIGRGLAESLAFGHGVQVRGDIPIYMLAPIDGSIYSDAKARRSALPDIPSVPRVAAIADSGSHGQGLRAHPAK